MKKYIIFAIPSLIALFALLTWMLQEPEPTRSAESIPTPEISQPTAPNTLKADTAEPTAIEEPKIVDASTTPTAVLTNKEEAEPETPKQVTDQALAAYITDNLDSTVTQWLVKEHVLSKFVRAINTLEEGKLVSKYRPLVMPQQAFSVQKQGEQLRISKANYDRYTPYILTLETIGEVALLKAFEHYYPALEQAYNSLGVNKGNFRHVTKRALQKLISTPVPAAAPLLTHSSVMYQYKDPELEKLPATHKLMIRMGAKNSTRLKTLVQKIVAKM